MSEALTEYQQLMLRRDHASYCYYCRQWMRFKGGKSKSGKRIYKTRQPVPNAASCTECHKRFRG